MNKDASGRELGWPALEEPVPDGRVAGPQRLIPIGVGLATAVGVATWLGWRGGDPARRPAVQPWVRRVPITMLVAALVGANYGRLADQDADLALSLVALGVLVGVVTFRRARFTEGKVRR